MIFQWICVSGRFLKVFDGLILSLELDLKFLIFGVKMVKTGLWVLGAELVTSVHGVKLSIYIK
jgi:hypothetical protein